MNQIDIIYVYILSRKNLHIFLLFYILFFLIKKNILIIFLVKILNIYLFNVKYFLLKIEFDQSARDHA